MTISGTTLFIILILMMYTFITMFVLAINVHTSDLRHLTNELTYQILIDKHIIHLISTTVPVSPFYTYIPIWRMGVPWVWCELSADALDTILRVFPPPVSLYLLNTFSLGEDV